MRKTIVALAVCLLIPIANGFAQSQPVVFSRDILPILQEKFAPLLHRESGLVLDSWETLMAGSEFGEVVIPFDGDGSLLIRLATQLADSDPLHAHAAQLSETDVATVREWIESGAPNDDGVIAYADASNLLYACIQGAATVAVIDMDANVVIRTIDLQELGFTPDSRPHHVAVEPDGSAFYVSLIGDDVVLKFSRENELIGRTEFERPGMLAVHQDQNLLFVGRSMKAVNPPQRIGRIDRSSMGIEEIDVFFPRPHALAIHPGGRHVYVGSLAQNSMATLDHETENLELTTIEGETHTLVQFGISPDGRTMVVGGQLTGQFFFIDTTSPETPVIAETIKVGAAPWHPVFSPDGSQVWLGNKMAGTATVVDMDERSVAGVVEGLAQPHGAAMSPDGQYVYISNNNLNGAYKSRYQWNSEIIPGTVAVINTDTHSIEKMLELGPNVTGLGTR